MVLSEELTSAVKYDEEGVVEAVHTWLQNLSRPEDINDVDEKGATVLILCIVAGGIRGGQDDEDTHTNYLTAIRWLLKAKLRGVRDAESQMCRYLSHAIEQLGVSESSQDG